MMFAADSSKKSTEMNLDNKVIATKKEVRVSFIFLGSSLMQISNKGSKHSGAIENMESSTPSLAHKIKANDEIS